MNLRDKLKKYEKNKIKKPKEKIYYNNTADFNNEIIENDYGEYLVSLHSYDLNYKHGLYEITKFFNNLNLNIIQDINNKPVDYINSNIKDKIIFVDTETTGLMGGTGTVAFLIGIGYFDANNFVVKQFLMRDYDEEPAMLADVKKLFDNKDIIVSFNGKSFDLPLIKTRLILNRYEYSNFLLHLDLLHSSRRIWSYLDSCSLNSLEKNIIDFTRKDDISGYLIPDIYFEFLDTKNLKLLTPIIKHNKYDILSLVTLFTHLKEIYLENIKELSPHELFRIGRIKEKNKEYKNCIKYYKKAAFKHKDEKLKYKAYKKLSWQYKRINRYNKAVEIWEMMISDNKCQEYPYIELAKYYEHKINDYNNALNYAQKARNLISDKKLIINKYKNKLEKIDYRIERLKRKNKNN